MPQFQYTARTKIGKKQSGKITASTRKEAYEKLLQREMRALEIQEIPQSFWTKEVTIGNPLKLKDFVVYLRQFSTLLQAGITVSEATRILTTQTESKVLRRTLEAIDDDLRAGHPLSDAYRKHKRLFSDMFISMVRAGETTGQLHSVLEQMADYYEKQLRMRQKVQSAMAYPIVVGIIAVAVVIFLLVSVVPTFVEMFKQNDTELPWLTKAVIASSTWSVQYWWVLLMLGVFVYINILLIGRNKASKYYLDHAILKTPVIGMLFQKTVIARMARTLSSLTSSAVPILQALSIAEGVVQNEVVARALSKSKESLQSGKALSEPLKAHWVFPSLVSNMIAIGEETGSLDSMLSKIADFYEAEVESAADSLKSLIEPVMIVVLSIVVGTIVLAIMVPLFKLYNNMH